MALTPQRSNIFLLGGDKFAIINRKVYRLEELDDEGMAEVFNGGEVLPLMQRA